VDDAQNHQSAEKVQKKDNGVITEEDMIELDLLDDFLKEN